MLARFVFPPAVFSALLLALGMQSALASASFLQKGAEAFRAGRLQEARQLFEAARESGLNSAKLFYNLGVVNYRLNDFSAAENYFRLAAGFPQSQQVAHYNLARCAQQQNDLRQADYWYQRAQRGSDEKVSRLAGKARMKLKEELRLAPSRALLIGLGFDSAVVGLVDQVTSEPTNIPDLFAELQAQYGAGLDLPVLGTGRWSVAAYALAYEDVQEAQVESAQASWRSWRRLSTSRRWGWQLRLAQDWLDQDAYQSRASLTLELEHQRGSGLWQHSLSAQRLQASRQRYRSIKGWRLDMAHAYSRQAFKGIWESTLRLEWNDRESDLNSPLRASFDLAWRRSLGHWQWEPSIQYRLSDYSDQRPEERRLRAQLLLATPLMDGDGEVESYLNIRLQAERNQTSEPRFAYRHGRVLLAWTRHW